MSKNTETEQQIIDALLRQRKRGGKEVNRQNRPEKDIYFSVPRDQRDEFRRQRQDKVNRSVVGGMDTFASHRANALRLLEQDLVSRGVAPADSRLHGQISGMRAKYTMPEERAAQYRRTVGKAK